MKLSHLTQNLKELRQLARLSQNQLSDLILSEFDYDLPRQKYSAYEEGRNEPNLSTLMVLSQFYGCSIDALISNNTLIDTEEEPRAGDSLGLRIQLAELEKEYQESQFKVIQSQYKTLRNYYLELKELYSSQNKEIIVEAPDAKPGEIIFVSLEHSFSDHEIYLITKEINLIGALVKFMGGIIFPKPRINPQLIKIMTACDE